MIICHFLHCKNHNRNFYYVTEGVESTAVYGPSWLGAVCLFPGFSVELGKSGHDEWIYEHKAREGQIHIPGIQYLSGMQGEFCGFALNFLNRVCISRF